MYGTYHHNQQRPSWHLISQSEWITLVILQTATFLQNQLRQRRISNAWLEISWKCTNAIFSKRHCWRPWTEYSYNHLALPWVQSIYTINTLKPRQNGRHFADDVFKRIFLNENIWIQINISLKFVSRAPINNIPTLVEIMAWRRQGDKPLSEPLMVRFLTHTCVTRPKWVKGTITQQLADTKSYHISTNICNIVEVVACVIADGCDDGERWDTFVRHFPLTHIVHKWEVLIYRRVSVWDAFTVHPVIIVYHICQRQSSISKSVSCIIDYITGVLVILTHSTNHSVFENKNKTKPNHKPKKYSNDAKEKFWFCKSIYIRYIKLAVATFAKYKCDS